MYQSQAHSLEKETAQPLLHRDTYDHDKFDIDLLRDVAGMSVIKSPWKFKLETFIYTWILFNSITTIMIIIDNFKKDVSEDLRHQFGYAGFLGITYTMMYFPLLFFFLLWLLWNNAFSETTFYMYIQRGAIIDFPDSSNIRYLLTHLRPLLFIVGFLGYVGLSVYAMFALRAGFGTIAVFLNNTLIGIGLFWWRNQSIEWKFVSISDFVQSFPDRNNAHGNIDEASLDRASRLMRDFTLTESSQPCYGGYMRNWYWTNQNVGHCTRVGHHLLYWFTIMGLGGLCFLYFYLQSQLDIEKRWTNDISPCGVVCSKLASSLGALNSTRCQQCLCECMSALGATDESIVSGCVKFANLPVCSGYGAAALCPTFQQCGFSNPLSGLLNFSW